MAGSTWGENYDEHVSRLDILHRELTKSLEEIRADPAHFRVVDAIISDHKLRVTANCYVGQLASLLEQGKYLLLLHIPISLTLLQYKRKKTMTTTTTTMIGMEITTHECYDSSLIIRGYPV